MTNTMTNTKTKTGYYYRALVALVATFAAMLAAGGVAMAATSVGNPSPIQIVDNSPANPYPSQVNVQNLSGKITDLNVRLAGYGHTFPDDVDVLLVGPQGQKALLMSNVGGSNDVNGVGIVLDDEAANRLPDDLQITDGVYKPTQGTRPGDGGIPATPNFPSPAPTPSYADNLSVFDGTDPNGTWKLYVVDDSGIDVGQFAGGWSLDVATNGPDIFTVDSTADTGDNTPDGTCSSPCTLREAIQESNATPDNPDTINFAVPQALRDPNTGVATIELQSALPPITEQVTINGYTQPGASPNTKAVGDDAVLKIELDGSTVPNSAFGLSVQNSSGSVIRGLNIHGFTEGVDIQGAFSAGNRVEGNFIGTDPSGTLNVGSSFEGVEIRQGASENTIGGSTPGKRNVISGSKVRNGIFLGSDNNLIQGNYIGTDKSGTKDFGNNQYGVEVASASGNTISGNVISGNVHGGLIIDGGSSGNEVLGNRIGTTAGGSPLGNGSGVFVEGDLSFDNLIGDGTVAGSNTIAFNSQDGVMVRGSGNGNTVSRNSIFSNTGLGIDLIGPGEGDLTNVLTPNDGDNPNTPEVDPDSDFGPNHLQNRPVVGSAKTSSTNTTVRGTLNSTPNETFVVRLYSNPAGGDEGKTFLGQTTVGTDGSGKASFTKALSKVSVGKTVTATATSAGGDTSEFSAPRTVTTA